MLLPMTFPLAHETWFDHGLYPLLPPGLALRRRPTATAARAAA
jgi:hypothetical protein